nr:hypothetical protein Iba_chr08eCG9270 [Ipomoea batatas]
MGMPLGKPYPIISLHLHEYESETFCGACCGRQDASDNCACRHQILLTNETCYIAGKISAQHHEEWL